MCVCSGRLYGADDFLPMLTYVLAQCDMPQLDNEILYMMELLDPSLLNGEGTKHTHTRMHTSRGLYVCLIVETFVLKPM